MYNNGTPVPEDLQRFSVEELKKMRAVYGPINSTTSIEQALVFLLPVAAMAGGYFVWRTQNEVFLALASHFLV